MDGEFEKAMNQAGNEFKEQFHRMRYIKKMDSRVVAVKMCFMRARDIDRENSKPDNSYQKFTFNISAFDFDQQIWDKCPSCGDPDINKESNGHQWQGCYRCHILLGKFQIKSMEPRKKPEKKEGKLESASEPEPEFKTAKEIAEDASGDISSDERP